MSCSRQRGLFLAALRRTVEEELPRDGNDAQTLIDGPVLDLVLVAALELAPGDDEVRDLIRDACGRLDQHLTQHGGPTPDDLLGRRLLRRTQPATTSLLPT